MTDHNRSLRSLLTALASSCLLLALAPACDEAAAEGELPDDLEQGLDDGLDGGLDEFRSEPCPAGWNLYGEWAGGFCCDGYTDGNTCSGSAICALDPYQTQGNRLCSTYECPSNWTLYGSSAGGFCCSGTPSGGSCSASICALDETRTQGYGMCDTVPECPNGKTFMSGMCCNDEGEECEVLEHVFVYDGYGQTSDNLAADFNDQVEHIVAYPDWWGTAATLYEHYNGTGQLIWVGSNEDLDYRPIWASSGWTNWAHVVSSFKYN